MGNNQREALDQIIRQIRKNVTIIFPDITKPFILECDASQKEFGSVLRQEHGIVGIFSKRLTKSEENYNIIEKEFLSIVKSLQHFRKIILGCEISVFTDNKNHSSYDTIENNRISRWKWGLSEYNLNIKHIKGIENHMADRLSRNCHIRTGSNVSDEQSTKDLLKDIKRENSTQGKIDLKKSLHHTLGHPGTKIFVHS